jgi:hypothetical protein
VAALLVAEMPTAVTAAGPYLTCIPAVPAVLSAGAAAAKQDWEGAHPWKPWDRDKDLNAPASKPKGTSDLLKAAGSLSNRFSSGR